MAGFASKNLLLASLWRQKLQKSLYLGEKERLWALSDEKFPNFQVFSKAMSCEVQTLNVRLLNSLTEFTYDS